MATDFTYANTQIVSTGPIKPSGRNVPSDPRTVVNLYADSQSYPQTSGVFSCSINNAGYTGLSSQSGYSITKTSISSHSHTVNSTTATNQNTGGDAEHNNMQPYIVLNYIIKYE